MGDKGRVEKSKALVMMADKVGREEMNASVERWGKEEGVERKASVSKSRIKGEERV